jgi:hypothetical protein
LLFYKKVSKKTGSVAKEAIKDSKGLLKDENELNSAIKNITSPNLKPLSRGSTGRAMPTNLNEQLALK